jgi:hypothetical protein
MIPSPSLTRLDDDAFFFSALPSSLEKSDEVERGSACCSSREEKLPICSELEMFMVARSGAAIVWHSRESPAEIKETLQSPCHISARNEIFGPHLSLAMASYEAMTSSIPEVIDPGRRSSWGGPGRCDNVSSRANEINEEVRLSQLIISMFWI